MTKENRHQGGSINVKVFPCPVCDGKGGDILRSEATMIGEYCQCMFCEDLCYLTESEINAEKYKLEAEVESRRRLGLKDYLEKKIEKVSDELDLCMEVFKDIESEEYSGSGVREAISTSKETIMEIADGIEHH